MYAKSFLALDGNGRLTGARTAQTAPYAHYTCHLCGSALRYHPQYDTERPWFEHTDDGLTEHAQQCPYVRAQLWLQSWLSQTDELSDFSVMTCSWPPH